MNTLEIFPTSGTTTEAGIFVPVEDLAGMTAGELSDTGVTLEGKVAYGFLNSLYGAVSTVLPLGLPEPEKTDPTGTAPNIYTEGVTIRVQRFLDVRTNTCYLPGLPTTGSYAGEGGMSLTDIWPGATKLGAGATTGGAGVLIPNDWIASYGGTAPATVGADARDWIGAFITAVNHTLAVRTSTVASSIIRKQTPGTVRVTGIAIPAEFYDETNPITNLTPADLPYLRLTQETVTIEYEILTDPATQTLEVRVASA